MNYAQNQERRVQGILNENKSWKSKYKDLLEHLDSPNRALKNRAMTTLAAMDNQARYVESLRQDPRMEATFTQNLGALVPRIIDLVRIFYPNMVTHDLVDVQSMDRMNGEIWVMKPTYSDAGGGVNAGDQVFKKITDGTYASESTSVALTGTVSAMTGTLPHGPIRPGSAAVTIRTAAGAVVGVFSDNGSGQIVGTGVTGTIDYTSRAVALAFSPDLAAGSVVSVVARYDSEKTPSNIRKLSLNFGSMPIQAQSHPLLIDWSVQAQLAGAAHLDVNIPQTLGDTVASFLKQERDVSLINHILRFALPDTNLNFDAAAPVGYSRLAKYAEIGLKLNYSESTVQFNQGRGGVSWVLCGTNAADVWRNSPDFEPTDIVAPIGPHKIGTLRDGTVAVIKNPFMDRDTYVIGFKGYVLGDAATILAEWIPLYATPVFQAPEMINSQGMSSFNALHDNPETSGTYYRLGKITNYAA